VVKRQATRQKYTDEEVQKICSMKEAGIPWRCIAFNYRSAEQIVRSQQSFRAGLKSRCRFLTALISRKEQKNSMTKMYYIFWEFHGLSNCIERITPDNCPGGTGRNVEKSQCSNGQKCQRMSAKDERMGDQSTIGQYHIHEETSFELSMTALLLKCSGQIALKISQSMPASKSSV
jgi:hypothetical protein